jgi:hypothetical protein
VSEKHTIDAMNQPIWQRVYFENMLPINWLEHSPWCTAFKKLSISNSASSDIFSTIDNPAIPVDYQGAVECEMDRRSTIYSYYCVDKSLSLDCKTQTSYLRLLAFRDPKILMGIVTVLALAISNNPPS